MLHSELVLFQTNFCQPYDISYSEPVVEKESLEYGGCSFHINKKSIQFRVGKITPTKIGFFVTFYTRLASGIIAPYDVEDGIDYFIIGVTQNNTSGFFILPKHALIQHNIISVNTLGGKRGFRLYLPNDVTTNKQAQKTQLWQKEYFFTMPNNHFEALFKLEY